MQALPLDLSDAVKGSGASCAGLQGPFSLRFCILGMDATSSPESVILLCHVRASNQYLLST